MDDDIFEGMNNADPRYYLQRGNEKEPLIHHELADLRAQVDGMKWSYEHVTDIRNAMFELMDYMFDGHPPLGDNDIIEAPKIALEKMKALRAKLKQAEEVSDDIIKDLLRELDGRKDQLAAKEAEVAERNQELDEAIENLKVLGQQQMDDFKKHKAEVERYRKAVEPVKEADDELLFVMITDKEIPEAEQKRIAGMCVKAVRDCIRILGEAGNERD